jgi:hypothetical protein
LTQPLPYGHVPGDDPRRDPRLAWFAEGRPGDTLPPSPGLTRILEDLSGPGGCVGQATDDEAIGMLGRWQALDSWVQARLLGMVWELIRRRALPGKTHGRLPDQWEDGLSHEIAAALGMSLTGADKLIGLAWELEARLPGIGAMLEDGTIDIVKTRIVVSEFSALDDEKAAEAEKLLLEQLEANGSLTPGKIGKLAQRIVDMVDPAGAETRRKRAEREEARVRFYRDHGGAAGMTARGLPTDQALKANANINQRAKAYKKEGICPDATMDQLRVLALCDKLNGVTLNARIAMARTEMDAEAAPESTRGRDSENDSHPAHGGIGGDCSTGGEGGGGGSTGGEGGGGGSTGGEGGGGGSTGGGGGGGGSTGGGSDGESGAGSGGPVGDDPDAGGPGTGGPGSGGPDTGGPDSDAPEGGPRDSSGPGTLPHDGSDPGLPARVNLTIPLLDLADRAQRPGEAQGLGSLDPALCRDLAMAAVRSPHSQFCVTVTSPEGYAIGHACARRSRETGRSRKARTAGRQNAPPGATRMVPPRTGWHFIRKDTAGPPGDTAGPPGGFGVWTLILPDGREFDMEIVSVPVDECDHRFESHSYQPSDTLRHLVRIRDGTCTFPCCSHPAAESDFEHAVPYDKGGKTCACNAGARSRRCHRVKQAKGWTVTQPRPGWHRWETPSGRTYIRGPEQYPA